MPDETRSLDQLLDAIENAVRPASRGGRRPDAIDRILSGPERETRVRSLRDDPVVARLREDLSNGLIRVDTANALFRVAARVLTAYTGA